MDSLAGRELADIALFTRVGDVFPRHGRHILMTRMYIQRTPTGAGNKAVTWAFGSPADLEEANRLLSEKFETEPVTDPRGMAAIEIRHPEFAAGTAEPMVLLDDIFQVLGGRRLRGHHHVQRPRSAGPGLTSAAGPPRNRRWLCGGPSQSIVEPLTPVPPQGPGPVFFYPPFQRRAS